MTTYFHARREKYDAELQAEYRAEIRSLKLKIRRAEHRVALYGGEIHIETLERLKAQLAAL